MRGLAGGQKKLALAILLWAAGGAGWLFWVHGPLAGARAAALGEAAAVRSGQAGLANFLNARAPLAAGEAGQARRHGRLGAALPAWQGESGFLAALERCAHAHRLELLRLAPGEAALGDGFREEAVGAEVAGGYFGLRAFLQGLADREAAGRHASLTGLAVRRGEAGALVARVSLAVFARPGG